jgi:uncharacterized cupredoxin-like copper-binding protein
MTVRPGAHLFFRSPTRRPGAGIQTRKDADMTKRASGLRTAGTVIAVLAAVAVGTIASGARADAGHGPSEIGDAGTAADVDRTIEVELGDNYFRPDEISLRAGETIRFVLRNDGELLHEFSIATPAMHAEHQDEMLAMMQEGMFTATDVRHETMERHHGGTMGHDHPNSVLVEPGEVGEMIWTFPEPTNLQFACNIPGHYQGGMHGDVRFNR